MNKTAINNKQDQPTDPAFIDSLVAEFGRAPSAIVPILHAIREKYRYLPEPALRRVCELTDITPAAMAGVASFYPQFRHRPVGRHLVSVCHGTACHVKGADLVFDAMRRELSLNGEEDTDADGVFTVQKVSCLGCCTLAPVLQIDGVTYGHMTAHTVPQALRDFLELERRGAVADRFELHQQRPEGLAEIRIGMGSCCIAGGSSDVRTAVEQAVREIGAPAAVKAVGCVGMCHQTPLVEVVDTHGSSSVYAKVAPADAAKIVHKHFKPRGIIRQVSRGVSTALDSLLTDESWTPVTRYSIDMRDEPVCAFVGRQTHIATEHCGHLDPLDLDEYLAHDGFVALRKCIESEQESGTVPSEARGPSPFLRSDRETVTTRPNSLSPDEVIDTIRRSGLRGRGGAGFPTVDKWAMTRAAKSDIKYVICNGDEGDPGAFMDRMILESYPYRVIEGMAIAAFAVGASKGFMYIRAEYPLAVRRIKEALRRCEERGLLGESTAQTNFHLDIEVMEGAGAFICGEETALIASIEGRRATPRLRPPYPAESGLWGRPTSINNVETYSLVPWIIRHGAEAFAALGTESSKGTKVFALAGDIVRGGLIEVPMGITIREVVEEIGGGVPNGRKFKAVQIGGPSGGCIPAELADTPIDYASLASVGAIMGSGGLVVIDDSGCMVDIARYFLEFTQAQSCGKCTFCRIGTRKLLDILDRLCSGEGRKGDIENLEELALQVKQSSLCGLGRTAPNPVLSTLHHFRDEYQAHLEGRCPAKKCKALITYRITDTCIGCTKCAQDCPAHAIEMKPYEKHVIISEKCVRCGACKQLCPVDAVTVD